MIINDNKGIKNLENQKIKSALKKCSLCENYFAREILYNQVLKKIKIKADYLDLCGNCRRSSSAKELARIFEMNKLNKF